jgi:hypothetical protein
MGIQEQPAQEWDTEAEGKRMRFLFFMILITACARVLRLWASFSRASPPPQRRRGLKVDVFDDLLVYQFLLIRCYP